MYLSGAVDACHCGGTCGPCSSWGLGQVQPPPTPTGAIIQAALPGLEEATSFIPVVGPIVSQLLSLFGNAFANIGRGHMEADEIVPTQNELMAYLGEITNQLIAQPGPNVPQLQAYLYLVKGAGIAFQQFVSNSRFIDGRASQQALNTVMPYIDGSCGYHWPPPMAPQQWNCLTWGDGTPGGPGTNGMYGAIQRAILLLGGSPVPGTPQLVQGLNSIGSLTSSLPGMPNVPQAGTLPQQPAGVGIPQTITIDGSTFDLSTLLPIGVGFLWLMALRQRASA